jgi:GNAT superfamily N-acetyltransferase
VTPTIEFQLIESVDNAKRQSQLEEAANLWNLACGPDLAISPRFVGYNLRPCPGGDQTACLALVSGRPVGFISTSYIDDRTLSPQQTGWIDAIAVAPDEQGSGIGSALIEWAEAWQKNNGTKSLSIGANPLTFVPGVPEELNTTGFFQRHGYGVTPKTVWKEWDVAADLSRYKPPRSVRPIDGIVRPAQNDDYDATLAFLQREFPDYWRYEFERYVGEGGRISDYMVLWTERGVDGACMLTFEDSLHPIERYYPYRLPRPWGQLGSIGVSADRRGRGYGAALLDAGLRRLHDNGVNGCVIDWTTLLDFYAKFGFTSYRTYLMLFKSL